jgi:hypothetical protein
MEVRTLVTFRSDKFNTTEGKSNYINLVAAVMTLRIGLYNGSRVRV